MPRNLPWKAAVTRPAPSPSPVAAKRDRTSPKRSRAKDDGTVPKRRSESASPPPAPPSEEFMNSGVSADDAYIMVEDEFLATARTFTASLHHAEYKRQKALARARKKQHGPSSTAELGRSSSVMSAALRRQKATAGNLAKSRAALEAVGAIKAMRNGSDSDGSNSDLATYFGEDGDSDDDGPDFTERHSPIRADDTWLGTSLAPLLSPRKRRAEAHLAAPPSLVGLHGVRSDTRAARGYGASDVAERRPQQTRREFDLPPPPTASNPSVRSVPAQDSGSETEGDSDDLDAPARASRPKPKKNGAESEAPGARRELRGLPSPPPRNTTASTAAASKRAPPTSSLSGSPSKTRPRPWLTKKDGKGPAQDKSRSGVNVNEIPTFLV